MPQTLPQAQPLQHQQVLPTNVTIQNPAQQTARQQSQSPSRHNPHQYPPQVPTTTSIQCLLNLSKLYADDNLKYGGEVERYDVLDNKLRIFYSYCRKCGVPENLYDEAYPLMLKGNAHVYFFQNLADRGMSFNDMITHTKRYFHTAEVKQFYLAEWRNTMLKETIASNPGLDVSQCLEMVIDKLRKVHQGLVGNYRAEHDLGGQLLSACAGVPACSAAFQKPSSDFESVAADLRSAIGQWMRCNDSMPLAFNTMMLGDDDEHDIDYTHGTHYVNRRYNRTDSNKPYHSGDSRGNSHHGGNQSRTYRRNASTRKKCYVCGELGCWSSRHPKHERDRKRKNWRSYMQEIGRPDSDYDIFLAAFEGIDPGDSEDTDSAADKVVLQKWFAENNTPEQWHTSCGEIDGPTTVMLLNNYAAMHSLTKKDPLGQSATEPSHLFHFRSRYDSEVFQGIMPDTGAAGVSTVGEGQVKALQKILPDVAVKTSTAGCHKVRFGDSPDTASQGTVSVPTPFGTIDFHILQANTPFLLCLQDMDRLGVQFNNIYNVLEHNGNTYPVIRKWGHPFFMLDRESSVICHLTETELRRLHRRFGHPAAERMYKTLSRAGYDNLSYDVIRRINKYCHQCQVCGPPPHRFRFTLRDDVDFNSEVMADVMTIRGRPVLHAVDTATGFQAARFLANMTAKHTWDTLREMWIDSYVGPPDILVTDAGTNFAATEFGGNARAMSIDLEIIPVEAHHSIGKVERYHGPLRRAYEVISADLGNTFTPESILQMAVEAVNDTAGPDGLVPTLLVFGTYPRISESSPPSPSITKRTETIKDAMSEVRKLKASRQVADALAARNGPNIMKTLRVPIHGEVLVWRESKGWTGPYTLLAHNADGTTCSVQVNDRPVEFRITAVKPYKRDDTTGTPRPAEQAESAEDSAEDDDDGEPVKDRIDDGEYVPKPIAPEKRGRGRPKGSKNKPKVITTAADSINQEQGAQGTIGTMMMDIEYAMLSGNPVTAAYITEKEKCDADLAVELRRQGKVTAPGAPFEQADQTEIEALIGRGVFRFERYDPRRHAGVRVFKSRMVHEIKGKATDNPYEKSRLVVQGYSDADKKMVLTQSPNIQRASQRVNLALAPPLLRQGKRIWLRDITQAYTQSETPLQRTILAELPKQIRHIYPEETIMAVIKPLYGIAEAGAHWWATYFKHHTEKLDMETSTYDPCLLVTGSESAHFAIVGMQTDDTLGISDDGFSVREDEELGKAKFLAKPKEFLSMDNPLLFNGCRLAMRDNGVLDLQQKNQGEKLRPATGARTYAEQRARGAYIATICQPEAAFDLSTAAQQKEPLQEDIATLNRRITWQINNSKRGLTYIPIQLETAKLFVFVDGSFANNQDLSSQIGFIIILANETSREDTITIYGNIIHWSSTKCKRVTRSILASEIYAMANGVDMGIAIGTSVNQIMARLGLPSVPLVVCTDSLSLYECLVKLGTTKEKRLMIDIMALRQAYERQDVWDIRWIDGRDNPADAMTKAEPNKALENFINTNRISLRLQGWVDRETSSSGKE